MSLKIAIVTTGIGALALLGLLGAIPLRTRAAEAPVKIAMDHPAVVELFTSQGCSSCPSADALLSRYADNKDVLLLSFHVTYWNHLGWRDPYSMPAFDVRQRDYAAKLNLDQVYTPQAVVQGQIEMVGSDEPSLRSALAKAGAQKGWITPSITQNGSKLTVQIPAGSKSSANVLLVGYKKFQENSVPSGENAGASLSHRNSATEIVPLGRYSGAAVSTESRRPAGDGVAVLVQDSNSGRIIGAAWR